MATASYGRYDGSRRFLGLSQKLGLPLDQTNFVICEILGMILALLFRYAFHHSYMNSLRRHLFSMAAGLSIVYFCHGREAIHLILLSVICYFIMLLTRPENYHKAMFAASFSYLSCIHVLRINFYYDPQVLDITGPMMLLTQKLTSLAYGLRDGLSSEQSQLTKLQKRFAIRQLPSPFEYFSYSFQFQTVLCGPLTYYPDYKRFIDGETYAYFSKKMGKAINDETGKIIPIPDPPFLAAVLRKTFAAVVFGLLVLVVWPKYPVARLKEEDFLLNTSLLSQTWQLILITTAARFKYYHAWLIADAISNASGLGFNGNDSENEPKWDLITNVNIPMFEMATSFRQSMQNWNIGTMMWLRYVAYERVSAKLQTPVTYAISAVWHGFHPGYYLTFGSAACFTLSSRMARKCLRFRFQSTKAAMLFYEVITFVFTKVCVAYIVFPFLLLELDASIQVYVNLNWYYHIICFVAYNTLPILLSPQEESEDDVKKPDITRIGKTGNGLKINDHFHKNGLVNGEKKVL